MLMAHSFCFEKHVLTKEDENIHLSRPIYAYLNMNELINKNSYFHFGEIITDSMK